MQVGGGTHRGGRWRRSGSRCCSLAPLHHTALPAGRWRPFHCSNSLRSHRGSCEVVVAMVQSLWCGVVDSCGVVWLIVVVCCG